MRGGADNRKTWSTEAVAGRTFAEPPWLIQLFATFLI